MDGPGAVVRSPSGGAGEAVPALVGLAVEGCRRGGSLRADPPGRIPVPGFHSRIGAFALGDPGAVLGLIRTMSEPIPFRQKLPPHSGYECFPVFWNQGNS